MIQRSGEIRTRYSIAGNGNGSAGVPVGPVPDVAVLLVPKIGAQPRAGQRLAAAGAAIVVRAAAMDRDDPGARILVALALEGEVVTGELTAGRAPMQAGGDAVDTRVAEPREVFGLGRSTTLEVVADDVPASLAAIRLVEGREAGPPVGQLGGLRKGLREHQPVGDRQAVRHVLRLALGAVEVEVDGITPAEHRAGVEPVRVALAAGEVDKPLAGPVRGQEREVAQGAVADAGHEIRVAIERRHAERLELTGHDPTVRD